MAFAMDAAAYDKVSAYTTGNKARTNWRKAGHAIIAHHRLLEAMALPGTSRRGNMSMDRAAERQRQAKAEAERVSEDQVQQSLRRNSTLSVDMLRDRRDSSITDISKVREQLPWSKAWYMNADGQHAQLTSKAGYCNRRDSAHGAVWVSQEQLEDVGVIWMKMPLNSLAPLDALIKERGYVHSDWIYSGKVDQAAQQALYREHFNRDEMMYLCEEGDLFVDFRDRRDQWIRMHLKEGDLIVVPAGCCHRLAFAADKELKLRRVFRHDTEPLWDPVYRASASADSEDCRVRYLSSRRRGTVCEDNHFSRGEEHDQGPTVF